MFFFFCFSVTSDDSCLVSLRRMARVCLDRRSRGRYLHAVSGLGARWKSRLDALLALVEEPQLGALVGVDDGQDLSDTLADIMDAGELGGRAAGDLGSPELDQLPLSLSASCPVVCGGGRCDVRLELRELGSKVVLGLVPELGGLLQRL